MRAALSVVLALGLSGCAWNVGGSLDLRHRREVSVKGAATASKPSYLPGASAQMPSVSYISGWPQVLRDRTGAVYWRLRDGKLAPGTDLHGGAAVLYGLVLVEGSQPTIDGRWQFVPTMLSLTADDVTLAGGIWSESALEDSFVRK